MGKRIHHLLMQVIPTKHRWKITLLTNWESIIGDLHDKVILEKIVRDSLVLRVSHSSWAQELYFLIPMLKEKINTLLGQERIKTIRLRTSEISNKKKTVLKKMYQEKEVNRTIMQGNAHFLTKQEQKSLHQVGNNELRSSLAGYAIRCKQIMGKGKGGSNGAKQKIDARSFHQ